MLQEKPKLSINYIKGEKKPQKTTTSFPRPPKKSWKKCELKKSKFFQDNDFFSTKTLSEKKKKMKIIFPKNLQIIKKDGGFFPRKILRFYF